MNRPPLFNITLALLIATCSLVFFLVFKVHQQNLDIARGEEKVINNSNTAEEKIKQPDNKIIFADSFDQDLTLEESGDIKTGTNPHWSVSSGAYLFSKSGVGATMMGDLPDIDPWFARYQKSSPADTDNGAHPQNIFRLVMLNKALNFEQEAYFKIRRYNQSDSPERKATNGLFLFNRYQDSDDVYYSGIRVDGYSSIKKKINGQYHTMKYEDVLEVIPYNRESNPNLLPLDTWIGLKSRVENKGENALSIKLYMDMGRTGVWKLIADTEDDGKKFGGKIINQPGFGGIRTDFMDVEFDDYKMVEL